MSRKHDYATRVDQLHADLRTTQRHHQRRAGTPPEPNMFTVDSDGVVRDQTGHAVYTPAKPVSKA